MHIHVVTIDLTDPRVRVRVCPGGGDPDGEEGYWNTSLQTVRAIAQRERLVVAVNGNFFQCKDTRSIAGRKIPYFVGNWARASGLAMSDGRLWSSHDEGEGTILVDKAGRVRIGYFHHDDAALREAQQMASGFGVLVSDGQLVPQVFDRDVAPRTAVGIDAHGKKLVMLVADGRRADYSVGLTSAQVSKEMIDLGCRWVLNLDGGGSSTMVMRSADESNEPRLLNRPSDGHDLPISMSFERAVACAVGVEIVEPKK
jgi:exopolysaccharide biosynthesis protein